MRALASLVCLFGAIFLAFHFGVAIVKFGPMVFGDSVDAGGVLLLTGEYTDKKTGERKQALFTKAIDKAIYTTYSVVWGDD